MPQSFPERSFNPPGPHSRHHQHTDGVPVQNQQHLLPGYYPRAQNYGEELGVVLGWLAYFLPWLGLA